MFCTSGDYVYPTSFITQKSTFLKIAVSFPYLIPSPSLPTDDQENSDRTPTQLPITKKRFLLISPPKKVDSIPKKVDWNPKTVHSFPKVLYCLSASYKQKNAPKSDFICISQKKSVLLRWFYKRQLYHRNR